MRLAAECPATRAIASAATNDEFFSASIGRTVQVRGVYEQIECRNQGDSIQQRAREVACRITNLARQCAECGGAFVREQYADQRDAEGAHFETLRCTGAARAPPETVAQCKDRDCEPEERERLGAGGNVLNRRGESYRSIVGER